MGTGKNSTIERIKKDTTPGETIISISVNFRFQ